MDSYKIQTKKGEGTYSEVFVATTRKTGKLVAIKIMKQKYDSIDRIKKEKEIQALKQLAGHPNIVKLNDVLYDETGSKMALVFELMDCNLYEYLKSKKKQINQARVRDISYQILKAVDHMHKKGIFHRDIKPQNILITGDVVKLADFGSCKNKLSQLPYTEYISTRWYRAPECILVDGYYDNKMDMWGVGCVMFELLSKFALFPGKDALDQLSRIHNVMGTPSKQFLARIQKHPHEFNLTFIPKKGTGIEKLIPDASEEFIDLTYKMLAYDPEQRITAQEALRHPCFRGMQEIYAARFNIRRGTSLLPPISPTLLKAEKSRRASLNRKEYLDLRLRKSQLFSKKFD